MLLKAVREVMRVFHLAPHKILFIWSLDVLQIVIGLSTHFFIGLAIDALIGPERIWRWVIVLIAIEILYLVIAWLNKKYDTRVYSAVKQQEKDRYYSDNISPDTLSITTYRLGLVDEVVSFLEVELFQILTTFGGVLLTLVYLLYLSFLTTPWLICWQLVFVVLSLWSSQKWRKQCEQLLLQDKDQAEHEHDAIDSLNKPIYRRYLTKRRKLDIAFSDADATMFLVMRAVQIFGLIGTIVIVLIYGRNVSVGLVYTAVTYIYSLNEDCVDVNDCLVNIASFNDNAMRIQNEEMEDFL